MRFGRHWQDLLYLCYFCDILHPLPSIDQEDIQHLMDKVEEDYYMAASHHPYSPQKQRWPTRKPLRLRDYDYSQPGYYFVTICTENRTPWFGTIVDGLMYRNAIGEIAQSAWLSLVERFHGMKLDQFVVMPNHLHGIIILSEETRYRDGENKPGPTLGNIINAFKQTATPLIRRADAASFAWQRGFHDRIIRHDRMLDYIRRYIETNPARWMNDEFYAKGG